MIKNILEQLRADQAGAPVYRRRLVIWNHWHKLLAAGWVTLVLGTWQTATANPVADIKSYVAAVDKSDWEGAATAAGRLLEYPPETLQISTAERTEMLAVAAGAAERAGQLAKAIAFYQRLIAEIETRDSPASYALAGPLRKLANLLADEGQLDTASSAYDRAVALSEVELGVDSKALLPIYEERRAIDRKRLATAIRNKSDNVGLLKSSLAKQDSAISTLIARPRSIGTRALNDPAFQLVTVHYGTNRVPTGLLDPAQFYGDQRGPLVLGIAAVSVPKSRAVGEEIPLPQVWRGDFRPHAAKHSILMKIDPSASVDAFAESARAQIAKSKRREALVFIHGYNSAFENSIFRAAQLAVDLNIDGAAFMYSWPSKGSLFGYVADGAQVIRPMVRNLQEFLTIVVQQTGAERVHVVAHSMGSRYLLEALDLMAREVPADAHKPMFQQMVFAAPDVDADDFKDRVKELEWMAQRMTLYASSKDRALHLSSIINGGYRRAGDAAVPITVAGLDTVDTTEVGAGGLGHGDFADRALDDFRSIVWLSLEPKSRCLLVDKRLPTGDNYWQLTGDQAEACSYQAFRTAILLARTLTPEDAVKYVRAKIEAARKEKDPSSEARYAAILAIFNMMK